jgi:hypothetical protein
MRCSENEYAASPAFLERTDGLFPILADHSQQTRQRAAPSARRLASPFTSYFCHRCNARETNPGGVSLTPVQQNASHCGRSYTSGSPILHAALSARLPGNTAGCIAGGHKGELLLRMDGADCTNMAYIWRKICTEGASITLATSLANRRSRPLVTSHQSPSRTSSLWLQDHPSGIQ